MKRLAVVLAAFALALGTSAAQANDFEPQIKDYFESSVKSWLADPLVVEAIKAQNTKHASLDAAGIDALDKQWRAEAKSGGGALISEVLGKGLSKFLTEKKAASDEKVTEIFIMDNKGLNVGQSDVTSDYMQGDEAKWQKTYGTGGAAVFVDEVEFDESAQSFQSQISATIVDPASGAAIGAITLGLNVENLL